MKDPLDEIFVDKVKHPTHSKIIIAEKDKEIEMLKEGISEEIDNLREKMKKIEKRNEYLEKRDKDCMRVFEDDRRIFKEQQEKIEDLKESLKAVEEIYSKLKSKFEGYEQATNKFAKKQNEEIPSQELIDEVDELFQKGFTKRVEDRE